MEKHTARVAEAVVRFAVLTAAAGLLVVLFRLVIPVNGTTVALAFLMLVLITASRWQFRYSVYLSLLSTLLYNFFFLPPVGRLTIEDPRNWVALVAFLVSGVLVSHLASRERRQAESSEARRREVERLYELSQQLLLQEDLRGLARSTPSITASIFGFRGVSLYLRDQDAVFYSDPANELLPMVEMKLISGMGDAAAVERPGIRLLPLSFGMRSLGALAITAQPYSPQIYEAIAGLVAIALERALAVERSSRLEASRQGERLRAALLDSVTHDLRTPLTAIRAAATTLASEADLADSARTDLVAVVDEESARLDRLIGQAVEMAELDAAAVEVRRRPQDVRELIETAVEDLQPVLRHHAVAVEIEPDLPRVPMDHALLHRVLRHILENAARYSPVGTAIRITATRHPSRLLVSVEDEGPGVDPAEQPFVFDKFFRGKTQKVQARGTGMGLAIAKAIVEAHGGGIELVSPPGHGARFTFWLPLVVPQSNASV